MTYPDPYRPANAPAPYPLPRPAPPFSNQAPVPPSMPTAMGSPPPLNVPARRRGKTGRYIEMFCFVVTFLLCAGILTLWIRSGTVADELRFVTGTGTYYSLGTHPHGLDFSVTRDTSVWSAHGLSLHTNPYGASVVETPDPICTPQTNIEYAVTVPDPPPNGSVGFGWDRATPSYRAYWAPMWAVLLVFIVYPFFVLLKLMFRNLAAPIR